MLNNSIRQFGLSALIVAGIFASSCMSTVLPADSEEANTASTQQIMVSTTESLEGYRIKEYKGIIRGVTVRIPGPVSSLKAGLKSMVGGKVDAYARMCETARQQATDALTARAQEVGANAVVGFRYDSSAYGDTDGMGTEVVCYGTAVVIVPRESVKAVSLEKMDSQVETNLRGPK